MKVVTILLSVLFFTSTIARRKRFKSLQNFQHMIHCRFGISGFEYNNYGCWCGLGGSGSPIDPIDECCMHHDLCYDKAIENGACYDNIIQYFKNYGFGCHTSPDKEKEIFCGDQQDACQQELCYCDKAIVNCWAKYDIPSTKLDCNNSTMIATIGKAFVSAAEAVIKFFG